MLGYGIFSLVHRGQLPVERFFMASRESSSISTTHIQQARPTSVNVQLLHTTTLSELRFLSKNKLTSALDSFDRDL